MEDLKKITDIMKGLLLCKTGPSGAWRPVKGTTRQQCYDALGEIQEIVKSNIVHYDKEA